MARHFHLVWPSLPHCIKTPPPLSSCLRQPPHRSAPEADASSSAERQQQKKKLQEDELKALVQALPGTQRYERSFGHDGLIHDICVAETHDGATIITVDSHGTMRWFKKIRGGEDDDVSMLVTPNHAQVALCGWLNQRMALSFPSTRAS